MPRATATHCARCALAISKLLVITAPIVIALNNIPGAAIE
jgi:hypothetical protein